MQKPNDYDTAQRGGEFKRLPASAYLCKIIRAEEATSKAGKPMLKVAIDIARGEYEGYFRDQFDRKLKYDDKATWPCVCYVVQVNDQGNTSGAFKNFVECIRESNNGWEPAWGEQFCDKLRGKVLGVIFREEEYLNQNGQLRVNTKVDYGHFVNTNDLDNGNYTIPERKLYEGNSFTAADARIPASDDYDIPEGFETIDEDDLPF